MTFQEITEIIAAGLGSIGFSMMFQLRGKKLILIGCGGTLSWFIFLFGKNSGSSLNGLLWAVIVAAAIAEIEARRRKTPVIVLEVPLLVPLIPGGDLYRMMVSIMTKGVRASIDPLVWLAQEVFVIAAGGILVSTVASLLVKATHAVRQSVR